MMLGWSCHRPLGGLRVFNADRLRYCPMSDIPAGHLMYILSQGAPALALILAHWVP
jgi:hypothetical protein